MTETTLSTDSRKLRALLDLGALVDDELEEALQDRTPLEGVLQNLLPKIAAAIGATAGFVRTFDEDLQLRTFVAPPSAQVPDLAEVLSRTTDETREEVTVTRHGQLVVAQALDVAGEWFGSAGFTFPATSEAAQDPAHLRECLETFCEQIDNFLHSIRAAREKHKVMLALARALRAPILAEGLKEAVGILTQNIAISKLLLVYRSDEGADAQAHVQIYEGGGCVVDTLADSDKARAEHARLQADAHAYLARGDKALARNNGFEGALEEVLLSGGASQVVGKVLVSSSKASFNTYDRELLGGFADFILQRVVDFNKEWRTLARSFRPEDVSRLLQTPNYVGKYLKPREELVGILFADISGFTRISEQVLVDPSRIGALVDAWGNDAVRVTWAERGVFDKMVGDCLIGLFGPPFYDASPGERLAAAIRAARGIIEATKKLHEFPGLEVLAGSGIGVSIGVNLAPLFVGRFGPNENFTGFSSGMNNTARLQHLASKDEIVVMADGIAQLPAGHGFKFGEERQAAVKNVAQPLRFRSLIN